MMNMHEGEKQYRIQPVMFLFWYATRLSVNCLMFSSPSDLGNLLHVTQPSPRPYLALT